MVDKEEGRWSVGKASAPRVIGECDQANDIGIR